MKKLLVLTLGALLSTNVMAWDGSNNKYILGGLISGIILNEHMKGNRDVDYEPTRRSNKWKAERNRELRRRIQERKRSDRLDREYLELVEEYEYYD